MVKRKATYSVDEWLKKGELAASNRRANLETTPEDVAALPLPTVEDIQVQVAEEDVAMASIDVATTNEEVANWFWDLLGRAGYEIW